MLYSLSVFFSPSGWKASTIHHPGGKLLAELVIPELEDSKEIVYKNRLPIVWKLNFELLNEKVKRFYSLHRLMLRL